MRLFRTFGLSAMVGMSCVLTSYADNTLGIGKYPGAPAENFAPRLVENPDYRNIALHRMVRTSSMYDYNLTSQLLTDGIVEKTLPPFLIASTRDGLLPRREREWAIDGNEWTRNILMGDDNYLQYEWNAMSIHADRVEVVCTLAYDEAQATQGYDIRVLTRDAKKGAAWTTVAEAKGAGLPGEASKYKAHSDPNKQTGEDLLPTRNIKLSLPIDARHADFSNLRVEFKMKGAAHWSVTQLRFFNGKEELLAELLPSRAFGSAWMSAKGEQQWAQIDLGVKSKFDEVRLSWLNKAVEGGIEVSDDAKTWKRVAALPGGKKLRDVIKTPGAVGRYVRVLMTKAATPADNYGYVLSEIEVMGNGGLTPQPHAEAGMQNGKFMLDGGDWRLQRASLVKATGEKIASDGFKTDGWIAATVPATVLTSYVNTGALDDPSIADNMFNASESFFNSNFWYRREFSVPAEMKGKHVFLNFDGINWKANIFLNGQKVDRIEGAFIRGRVDVSKYLKEGKNVLAVEIVKNAHPGAIKEKNNENTDFNGGALGYDNPTFHATVGWDWISTIRGRDIGIWNDVYLTASEAVSLKNPLLTSRLALPDTTATMTPRVVLDNAEAHEVSGTLRGWIGDIKFEKPVKLAAGASAEVTFSPEDFPQLRNRDMKLWWPNGYGTPYLYDAGFEFTADGSVSDKISYKAGIRQMDYRNVSTKLEMFVNGKRFVPLGGNWGFSEQNLNYRGREYDIAVKYHRDMNFNMIRNWVGMIGDEEFYEACDKYGIMVWQDFWLANPADGPDPKDEAMFMANAKDYTARMRNHPSIGLYCGRNEGYPPATIDKQLRQTVAEMNPGLVYISSSADDGVSGHGPYWAEPAKVYFEKQTGKLHSERGMPNVMTFEGLSRTLAPESLWPQGDAWGQHDYTQAGAQRGATFNRIIETAFGKPTDAQQFTALAQWENYEGYRAMYESGSKYRQGLLIWMSHACWPSMTWQCYDYYFEPTAAFFGCRKACEPLHIQWNALTRDVEVVNLAAGAHKNIIATRQLIGIDGKTFATDRATISVDNDTTVVLPQLHVAEKYEQSGCDVFFVKLSLNAADGKLLSDNFYVLSANEGNLQCLNNLAEVNLVTATERNADNSLKVTLRNESNTPAMMIRLNLKADDGDQVLPVDYSDNYFHLMPGEERTVTVKWNRDDARRQTPFVEMSGFNVKNRILR